MWPYQAGSDPELEAKYSSRAPAGEHRGLVAGVVAVIVLMIVIGVALRLLV